MNIYNTAYEALTARHFNDAIALTKTALESSNDINQLSLGLTILAHSYIELGEFESAIAPMIQACRLGSDHARLMAIDWCQRERDGGEWAGAISLARQVFDADRGNHRIARELIDLLLICGRYFEALEIYKQQHIISPVIEAKYGNIFTKTEELYPNNSEEFEVTAIKRGDLSGYPTLVSSQWPKEEIEARLTSRKYGSLAWFLARLVRDNFSTVISLGTDYGMHELLFTAVQKPPQIFIYEPKKNVEKILEEAINSLDIKHYISFLEHISSTMLRSLQSVSTLVLINTEKIAEEIYNKLLKKEVFPGYVVLYGTKKTLAIPKTDTLHSWWSCDAVDDPRFSLSTGAIGIPLFPPSGPSQ